MVETERMVGEVLAPVSGWVSKKCQKSANKTCHKVVAQAFDLNFVACPFGVQCSLACYVGANLNFLACTQQNYLFVLVGHTDQNLQSNFNTSKLAL